MSYQKCPTCGCFLGSNRDRAARLERLSDDWECVATGASRSLIYKLRDRYGDRYEFRRTRLTYEHGHDYDSYSIDARRRPA